jgi:hypothetical protein
MNEDIFDRSHNNEGMGKRLTLCEWLRKGFGRRPAARHLVPDGRLGDGTSDASQRRSCCPVFYLP